MKKTVSFIYRFIFILFSVWGIFRNVGVRVLTFTPDVLTNTIFLDTLCLILMLVVFLVSMNTYVGKTLYGIKCMLTMLSIWVFFNNTYLLFGVITYDWILGILIPLMMILDWIIFDTKGRINVVDPIKWALGAFLIGLMFNIIKSILSANFSIISNFGTYAEILKSTLTVFICGMVMFIVDSLFLAFSKKNSKNATALIYKIVFILLEIYAIFKISAGELTTFIDNLSEYHILVNFFALVVVLVSLIINLIKTKNLKKRYTPFPRLKVFSVYILLLSTIIHILSPRNILYIPFYELIFYYIAPIMLMFDWLLFDKKRFLRGYDPVLWTIFPVFYLCFGITFSTEFDNSVYLNLFSYQQPESVIYILITLFGLGYLFYLVDKLSK